MKAAILDGPRDLNLREIETPTPESGHVLVKVKACGICFTDYAAYSGQRENYDPPVVVGHEFSGVVEEVGDEVQNAEVGDEVVASPTVHCGKCRNCRLGMPHYCENGIIIGGDGQPTFYNGAFAEYTLVPDTAIYQKPEELSFEEAALTEPLGGSYKGMVEKSNIRVGEDVVIIGVGSMGNLLTQVASAAGAAHLIAVDISDYKLEYATKSGANYTINSKQVNDLKSAVYDIIPEGPHIVFEAAGVLEADEQAMELARNGTRVNMFGTITPGEIPVSPRRVHFNEININASYNVTPRAMLKSLNLMENGLVDTESLITHRFSLEEVQEALDLMESEDRLKIMVKPQR